MRVNVYPSLFEVKGNFDAALRSSIADKLLLEGEGLRICKQFEIVF